MSAWIKYVLLGGCFGLLFPLLATMAEVLSQGLPLHLASMIVVQRNEPLLWVIDTAPFFLGLFAAFAGWREDRLHEVYTRLQQRADETRQLQHRLAETEQLQALTGELAQRTEQLNTIAEISSQMNTFLELGSLLQYTVKRLQEGYDFYHTHVYLLDETTGDLIMAEGYGEVGRKLKEAGHRLGEGRGIVGTVASTNAYFLSNNVNEVLNFVPNPLLPETNSELALPLRKGGKVLGVLDVQSKELNRFSPTDATILQSIANQLAVSIDNIRLLEDTRRALQEVERLNRRLTREGWAEATQGTQHRVYRFVGGGTSPKGEGQSRVDPAPDLWLPAMKQAVAQKQLVIQGPGWNVPARGQVVEDPAGTPPQGISSPLWGAELAVPLMLRGEVIGVVGVKRKVEDPAGTSPQGVSSPLWGAGGAWREEEIEAVKEVADQTAAALENARLAKAQEKTITQLRDVDRLKSEFLTSMSHELRTPLNSIIGFADILLQGIDGPLNEQSLVDITAIHNSGKHLLALINDILDLSKIEAGRMELAYSPIPVDSIFTEVTTSVSSLIAKKPVDLIADAPEGLPMVWADSLRLSQVLINLVSNAIKFTDQGRVTMKARAREDNFVEISVSDTGMGIPRDKFELVFEHFRQVDSRTNRKYQGTGMGLAIARQLVELHGGKMWLESIVGQGSTFRFTMPIAGSDWNVPEGRRGVA